MDSSNFKSELYDPTDVENYTELFTLISNLAKNDKQKQDIQSILMNGYLDDYCPRNFVGWSKDNDQIEFDRRVSMAMLLATNPETFYELKNSNINLFHGTNANALPGIIKYGIQCSTKQTARGEDIKTGERFSRFEGKRDFISFTDVLSMATGYSSIKPSKNNSDKKLDFPVIIGITGEDLKACRVGTIASDRPEIGALSDVPFDRIRVIMVPTDKVNLVKKMLNTPAKVLAYDVKSNDYFYMYTNSEIKIYPDTYQEFQKKLNKQNRKSMNLFGVKEMVKGRKIFDIRYGIDRLKALVGKDEEYDKSGSTRR